MTWLSDTYSELKSKWQRFKQWERFTLLREKEWRFPVYGTADEFEQRFNNLIPSSSPDEFFNMRKRRKTSGLSGFCMRGEVAVNAPNPRISGVNKRFLDKETSIYHFHGSLNQDRGGLYLYGRYRLPHQILRMISSCLIYGAILLGGAVVYGVQIFTGAFTTHLFINTLISYLPFFALIFVLVSVMNWLLVRHLERRDRPARMETQRLLLDICGSPSPKKPPI